MYHLISNIVFKHGHRLCRRISFACSRCRGEQLSWLRGSKDLIMEQGWRNLDWQHEKRRVRGDLIETFKILTARERVKKEDFFQLRQREYNLRGHQYSLEVQRSRINIWSHFFSQQTVKHWNALPDHVVSASSVNNFKNRLDSCAEWGNWKRKLLQPDTIKRQVSKLSIQYGSNVADMWQLRVEYNSQITQL